MILVLVGAAEAAMPDLVLVRALPALALVAIIALDLVTRPEAMFVLLAVIPLLAAAVGLGEWGTAAYGASALVFAGVLGIWDDVYEARRLPTAVARLVTIAVASVLAVMSGRVRRRYESRLNRVVRVAEAAQRAILLPLPDRLGPAEVAAIYQSASVDALIGGDLYGAVVTPFGVRFLVGDVRGKGLDAVQLTAHVLAAFRERAGDDQGLGDLMDSLDDAVTRVAGDEDFVTAVLVQIADDGTTTVVNAGHPWPYVVHGTTVEPVAPAEIRAPLGFGDPSVAGELSLVPGDRLLLYTDGLTEARDRARRDFLPESAITDVLAAGLRPIDVVDSIRERALAWSGGCLDDDLAIVLLEFQPLVHRIGSRQPDESPRHCVVS